jgi:hypothetical protein
MTSDHLAILAILNAKGLGTDMRGTQMLTVLGRKGATCHEFTHLSEAGLVHLRRPRTTTNTVLSISEDGAKLIRILTQYAETLTPILQDLINQPKLKS